MTEHAHDWLPIPDTNAYVCVCGTLGVYASSGPAPWSGRFGASISERTLSDAVRAVRAATIRECAAACSERVDPQRDHCYPASPKDANDEARACAADILALLGEP